MLFVVFVVAALAAYLLYHRLERAGRAGVPLAALRAAAWGLVAALLVNPSCSRSLDSRSTVLLDASASMLDPDGDARWRAALDTARAAAGGSGQVLLFGADVRPLDDSSAAGDPVTLLLPALREAAARGAPVVIVTDGMIDDAHTLPGDLIGAARVVMLARQSVRGAGVAGIELPASLRAGDTALAVIDIATAGTSVTDSVTLELLEAGRLVSRARISVGSGGVVRRDVRFVPGAATLDREVRRYEVRISGLMGDAEPRDDARATVAAVSRASAIALVSDSPDWDFRWLAQTLSATSGVPVRSFVRVAGTWRDARSLMAVNESAVRDEVSRAALVVAHGGDVAAGLAAQARRAVWRWPVADGAPGDWYVQAPEFASPAGGALAGVPVESLPPLESTLNLAEDSVEWTALTAQLERRGRSRPVVQGTVSGTRRGIRTGASGFWRWASRGGVSAEAYRALVAALTDWALEDPGTGRADLIALRDSLAREGREFLPRTPTLSAQPGGAAAAGSEPMPLRHVPWLYAAVLLAIVTEWIARRRRGLR